jgi:UV DNA damage endonuclease
MIVRFGYVAMSVHIKNASPSKTMTATNFSKLADRDAAIRKLEAIAKENLHNTLRLLRHNRAEEIHLYRLSSKLIPLLTHEMLAGWDPMEVLEPHFREVGDYAKAHGIRLSFHPDHFTVLSTPRSDVLTKSRADLERHVEMLERMGLDERYKCNIHIGGTYGDKEQAYRRFIFQFNETPERIRRRITLENDDKTFTARETLDACKEVGVPMVLDIHHHWVNNGGERAAELWPEILQTWEEEKRRISGVASEASDASDGVKELLAPKIHVSSPKSDKDPRGHADYVDAGFFLEFAREIAPITERLDVMIEAKRKDDALFTLIKELSDMPGIRKLDGSTIEM